MAKKPSGLGRNFGDLLDDNSLENKTRSSVVLRGDSETGVTGVEVEIPPLGYEPKSLYDEKPKRSIKANFKK